MQCYDKWPGTTVIYKPYVYWTWKKPAIEAYVAPPAKLIFNSLTNFGSPSELILGSTIPTSPITHHFAQFTITESVVLRAMPAKIKVDNLLIFGRVEGIDQCIDFSSVRQLWVDSNYVLASDVFNLADQFTRLQDLFIVQGQH